MGIRYDIDHGRNLILTTWEGTITEGMLIDHLAGLLTDPEVLRIRRNLADIRDAVITFTGPQLRRIVREVVDPRLGEGGWRTAILVANAVQFGVARQYGFYAWRFSQDEIFFERPEALAWLEASEGTGA